MVARNSRSEQSPNRSCFRFCKPLGVIEVLRVNVIFTTREKELQACETSVASCRKSCSRHRLNVFFPWNGDSWVSRRTNKTGIWHEHKLLLAKRKPPARTQLLLLRVEWTAFRQMNKQVRFSCLETYYKLENCLRVSKSCLTGVKVVRSRKMMRWCSRYLKRISVLTTNKLVIFYQIASIVTVSRKVTSAWRSKLNSFWFKLNQEWTYSAGETSTITKLDLKTVQGILAGTALTLNEI